MLLPFSSCGVLSKSVTSAGHLKVMFDKHAQALLLVLRIGRDSSVSSASTFQPFTLYLSPSVTVSLRTRLCSSLISLHGIEVVGQIRIELY